MSKIVKGNSLFESFLEGCINDIEEQGFSWELSPDPSFDLIISMMQPKGIPVFRPLYLIVSEDYISNSELREVALSLPANAFIYLFFKTENGWLRQMNPSFDFLTEEERREKLLRSPKYLA